MIFQSEEEVRNLIQPIIDLYKKAGTKISIFNTPPDPDDIPEFYPTYKKTVQYYERVMVHSEVGDFPEKLFKERAPNAQDKEYKYIRANFKQNTIPVFIDYISTVTRCFNDGNWNIFYEKQSDVYSSLNQTFQQYVESGINNIGSLENFVKFILPSIKSKDATGVMAVKPQEIFYGENSETDELIIDNTRLLEPQPYYYTCRQALSDPKFDKDYFILESCDKSVVEYKTKRDKVGLVFEVYDEQTIWRIEQVGKFTDYDFEVKVYFQHGWGKIPCVRLMGVPQLIGDTMIWQPPFLYACDLLDLALVNENYLQCSLANTMFPYRIMLGSKCTHQHRCSDGQMYPCVDGKVFDSSLEKDIDCPKCKGFGVVNRVSPLGEMLLFPRDLFGDGDQKFTGKAMEYVSPETAASEFVMKKIDRDIAKAYDVIKAKPSSQAKGAGINNDGTATGEIMDLKAQFAAAKMFSDQAFTIYEFLLDAIGWQRYGEDYVRPTLSYPVTFDFNTEQDYLKQITEAQNAKLAPFVIQHIIYKYLQTLYYNERQTSLIFNLIVATDRLMVLSQQDVLLKEKFGLADKWEVILHDSSIQFVNELIEEKKEVNICGVDDCYSGFFALPFDEQKKLLIEKAKAKADSIKSASQSQQQNAVDEAVAA